MMKLTPAHRLALLACLPAAAGASAGTVTLLSQERSVSATFSQDVFLDPSQRSIRIEKEDFVEAEGFDAFTAEAVAQVTPEELEGTFGLPGGNFSGGVRSTRVSATQQSSIEQRGDSVAFEISGAASPGPAAGSESEFLFDLTFSVDAATAFELTGTSNAVGLTANPFFFSEDGDAVLNLRAFRDRDEFDFSRPFIESDYSMPAVVDRTGEIVPNTGVIQAGSYRFGILGLSDNPGFDASSSRVEGFGLILRDSTLAGTGNNGGGGPVPIPSPAALPAGLACSGAGLMRRRRDAAA